MPPKGPGSSAGKKKQQKDNKRNCKLGETNGMMVIRVENVGWNILNRESHLENISVGKCQKNCICICLSLFESILVSSQITIICTS